MSQVVLLLLLLGTGALGTLTVLTRNVERQALVLGGYGLVLGVLMLALQAPDVALSQIGVGAAVIPLLVLLTAVKCRRLLGERDR